MYLRSAWSDASFTTELHEFNFNEGKLDLLSTFLVDFLWEFFNGELEFLGLSNFKWVWFIILTLLSNFSDSVVILFKWRSLFKMCVCSTSIIISVFFVLLSDFFGISPETGCWSLPLGRFKTLFLLFFSFSSLRSSSL